MVDYHWVQLVLGLGYNFLSLKKGKKNKFSDPKIGPANDKNHHFRSFGASEMLQGGPPQAYGKSQKIWALQHFNFKEKQASEKSAGTMCPPTPLGLKNKKNKLEFS